MSAVSSEILPVNADTCTVLGSRFKATSPAWLGLNFSKAVVRNQSTLAVYVLGSEDAPVDLHLDVPFCHPDDDPALYDGCRYRVRPRMQVRKRWKNRMVKDVRLSQDSAGNWQIEIFYAPSSRPE